MFEHCYNVFCTESSVLSRSKSFFCSLSKITLEDTRVWLRDLGLQPNTLPQSYISSAYRFSITLLQTLSGCLSTVTRFFVPSQMFSPDRCRFSLIFQKFYKRTPGAEPGTSRTAAECPITELYPLYLRIQKHHFKHVQLALTLEQFWLCEGKFSFVNLLLIFYYCVQSSRGLQLNALPLSYIPSANRFLNITANTCMLFEHCYNVLCSESSALSRLISFSSSLSKVIPGDTRYRTRDLLDCSWVLYHWAISPLHTDSITSLQRPSGCLSTVTTFFVPSQMFSRDRCRFSLVFQKFYKRTPGAEPGTSRTAAECPITELYPLRKQIP